jgi:hypothetical protein
VPCIGAGLLFLGLASWSTAPLIFHVTTHLPAGAESADTVPLLNLWTIGWNVDRLHHGYRGYWDAPIFYPTRGTLALSEPQTVAGWFAWPLWQLLPSPASVYSVLLLLFLTLNGCVGYTLLRRWNVAWPVAVSGGAMITLLPIVHWQLGVFQLVSLWGICWTLCACHTALRRRRVRDGLHVGLAFSCTYLLCCYFGLMLSILLLLCLPFWCGRRLWDWRLWRCGGVAAATAAVLLAPVIMPQVAVARQHGVDFPLATIRELSVTPAHYRATPGDQWLPLPALLRCDDAVVLPLSPGTLKYVFAPIGVVYGWRTRRRRRLVLFLTGVAVLAMLMSMGPRLHFGGYSPYWLFATCYPGYRHARNIYRFAFFVQLACVLLATLGLDGLLRLAWRHSRRREWRVAATMAISVCGMALAGEAWPPEPRLFAAPPGEPPAAWIEWLRAEEHGDARLICFPLAPGRSAADHAQTTVWMYYQLFHHRPLANGYSAVIPEDYLRLEESLASFPDAAGVAALRAAGLTHCLFDMTAGATADATALRAAGCERAFDDQKAQVQIWRLPP